MDVIVLFGSREFEPKKDMTTVVNKLGDRKAQQEANEGEDERLNDRRAHLRESTLMLQNPLHGLRSRLSQVIKTVPARIKAT